MLANKVDIFYIDNKTRFIKKRLMSRFVTLLEQGVQHTQHFLFLRGFWNYRKGKSTFHITGRLLKCFRKKNNFKRLSIKTFFKLNYKDQSYYVFMK